MRQIPEASIIRLNAIWMFPKSQWEFRKWDRQDWGGVIGASLGALSVLALLLLLVNLGS